MSVDKYVPHPQQNVGIYRSKTRSHVGVTHAVFAVPRAYKHMFEQVA